MGKLRDKLRSIISGRAIDYAARKYIPVGEWQTDAAGSGRGRRSPSIVIHEEATQGSYGYRHRRRTRNFHAACQNGPFTPSSSFSSFPARIRVLAYIRTYVCACELSASGICNAKHSPARRSLIMHFAWRRCATIESPGRALRCARSSARIDFPHNILTMSDPSLPAAEFFKDSLLRREI